LIPHRIDPSISAQTSQRQKYFPFGFFSSAFCLQPSLFPRWKIKHSGVSPTSDPKKEEKEKRHSL
jgi:hypothetical protein